MFPDGLAFDAEGALWVTSVITNRLIRVAPDLTWTPLLEDIAPSGLDAVAAYARGDLTFDQIALSRGSRLCNLSSLAFGGPDLRTLYLGGLGAAAVQVLRSPVAGQPMAHWR
jgi:sugar lactone lactonase YvrE